MKNQTQIAFFLCIFILTIPVSVFSQSTIANWNFDDSDIIVDVGTGTFTNLGGGAVSYVAGALGGSDIAISRSGWPTGTSSDPANCWQIEIDTTQYADISFAFDAKKSNTGPTQWQVYYSINGGGSYTGFETPTSITNNGWSTNSLDMTAVSAIEAQSNVILQIRAYQAGSSTGTWRVDNIIIQGSPLTTATPIETQTPLPTSVPTDIPTDIPTLAPTETPTSLPTSTPTAIPTSTPTDIPTDVPTAAPTGIPTSVPTETPTSLPTSIPTSLPTSTPTNIPTDIPTTVPTDVPTTVPTDVPTNTPIPSEIPTIPPTVIPTEVPATPTAAFTEVPTTVPTEIPTEGPVTATPSEPTQTPMPMPIPASTPTGILILVLILTGLIGFKGSRQTNKRQ